jgi:hypothetical protein
MFEGDLKFLVQVADDFFLQVFPYHMLQQPCGKGRRLDAEPFSFGVIAI